MLSVSMRSSALGAIELEQHDSISLCKVILFYMWGGQRHFVTMHSFDPCLLGGTPQGVLEV